MDSLLALGREDFVRVMRAVRNTVDATRRAIDDPTGAYTDLVAALESLGEGDHAELSVVISIESAALENNERIGRGCRSKQEALPPVFQLALLLGRFPVGIRSCQLLSRRARRRPALQSGQTSSEIDRFRHRQTASPYFFTILTVSSHRADQGHTHVDQAWPLFHQNRTHVASSHHRGGIGTGSL
jgi:hypothetical protein